MDKMAGANLLQADVCVVGAGIVGLAHALEAERRGLRVVLLERDTHAVGASIRNFGHVFVAAMADGTALDFALRSRERWIELGRKAGLEVVAAGSLVVARHEDELAVLEDLAADSRRDARVVPADRVGELAPIPTAGVVGGLHARGDLRVDPRRAAGGLASLLAESPRAEVRWGRHVHAVEPGIVYSTELTVRAPLVIVCPGPDFLALPPELRPRQEGLTRCRLQMLRLQAPADRRYGPAMLTGLSLLRYPGFTVRPGTDRVAARLARERPALLEAGIHLIVTQLPKGDLVVGDTHEYGDTPSPFRDERLDNLVLDEVRSLLGVESVQVRERWQGVYPVATGDPFLVATPLPGVRVVEVVAGIGMTTALGMAPAVLDEALEAQRAA